MPVDPWDQIFQQYAAELSGYLKRQLDSPELAADLCHEVYLRLRRSEAPAPSLDNPRAFLFRIARNLLIDHHRRQRSRPAPVALSDADAGLESPHPGPESAASQAQALNDVHNALAELPDHVRRALLWNRLDGLTQKEIGARLGVSERMAGKYILRALTHCQARLRGNGEPGNGMPTA